MIANRRRNLILVLGITTLLIAAFLGYVFYMSLKRAKMASQVSVLAADVADYYGEMGKLGRPPSLDEFLAHVDARGLFSRDRSGQIIDTWGHPLVVRVTESPGWIKIIVTSTGRDGQLGTSDDFSRHITIEFN